MKGIEIKLLTKQHDEIGRLPLTSVEIEDGTPTSPLGAPSAVVGQVEELYNRIESALKSEQFTLVGDMVDFRLRVSRALLADTSEATVVVPLTVEPLNPGQRSDIPTGDNPTIGSGVLDELFDLPINSGESVEVHK